MVYSKLLQNLFDEWYTEKRIVTDQIFQVDIGSTQAVNSPKFLNCAHQTAARSDPPNKQKNISVFVNPDVRKYFVEVDSDRYPRDGVLTSYGLNDYLDQYKVVKFFYKEYVGEELLNPLISYLDMKNRYPIQVIDLRFQVEHITPKKINCLKNIETTQLMQKNFFY